MSIPQSVLGNSNIAKFDVIIIGSGAGGSSLAAILAKAGKKVLAVQVATYEDVLAPNTRQQLAEADSVLQQRIYRQGQRRHRDVLAINQMNMGNVLTSLGRGMEALKVFEEALRQRSSGLIFLRNVRGCVRNTGRFDSLLSNLHLQG